MDLFKTSAILSFTLLICAPAYSMSSYFGSCADLKNNAYCAFEAAKENPVEAAAIGAGITASAFYLYKKGFFHASAQKAKNAATALATSETAHAIAAGAIIGAGTGYAAEYLEKRGMDFFWAWAITVPLRWSLTHAYQEEMKKKNMPLNSSVFENTAQLADWATYLRNARINREVIRIK